MQIRRWGISLIADGARHMSKEIAEQSMLGEILAIDDPPSTGQAISVLCLFQIAGQVVLKKPSSQDSVPPILPREGTT